MKMKKTKMFASVVLVSALVLLQAVLAAAAPAVYKTNYLTAQHKHIEGTQVSLVLPSGAVQSKMFRGFEIQSRKISCEVQEQRGAFETHAGTLTKEGLEADAIEVQDITDIMLNDRPAKLITGRAYNVASKFNTTEVTSEIGVLLLVAGNGQTTTFIYGYYPLADQGAPGLLRTTLLSVVFGSGPGENTGGGYTLSTAGTGLQYAKELSMTRYYLPAGQTLEGDGVQTAQFTSTMLTGRQVPQDQQPVFAKETFERYLSSYEPTYGQPTSVTVAGMPGIELLADFTGAPRKVRTASGGHVNRTSPGKAYQLVLFGTAGQVYVLQGIAVRDAESYVAQFKRMSSSFTLKK